MAKFEVDVFLAMILRMAENLIEKERKNQNEVSFNHLNNNISFNFY